MQCTLALRTRIQAQLRAFTVQAAARDLQHAAAVAVVITDAGHGAGLPGFTRHAAWSTQAALILTRRASHLRKHAGQWALPGGRIDAGETAEQAALRELAEEVHLELDAPMLELEGHGEHPVLRMPVGSGWIAAPTAAVLYQFREVCIEGRATRVAHFEQPAFAWK